MTVEIYIPGNSLIYFILQFYKDVNALKDYIICKLKKRKEDNNLKMDIFPVLVEEYNSLR